MYGIVQVRTEGKNLIFEKTQRVRCVPRIY